MTRWSAAIVGDLVAADVSKGSRQSPGYFAMSAREQANQHIRSISNHCKCCTHFD